MEKTRQQEINDIVSEALMGLKEAHEYGGKSRELLLKLLQFEGNRIDSLENKIDLLMTDRAKQLSDEAESSKRKYFLSSKPVGGGGAYIPKEEEVIPTPNEEIHFEDYHFEVNNKDFSEAMDWDSAGNKCKGDWRLPTIDELRLMYLSKDKLRMSEETYWSSSEGSSYGAWAVNFSNGSTFNDSKDDSGLVRLVRTIEDE
tara:strand:+ start:18 stop:617 length:600 start_codon:yes stop_codon:yes gene_type:complete